MFGRNNNNNNNNNNNKSPSSNIEEKKESRHDRKEREKIEKAEEQARKERFELLEESWTVGVEYMGGHKLYPKKKNIALTIGKDGLFIKDLGALNVSYDQIKNLENIDEKRITKTRIVLLGVWGLLWKKKFLYTVVDFNDGLMDQSVIIDCGKNAGPIQQMIYNRMLEANKKIPEMNA